MGSNDFINNYLVPLLSVPERAIVPSDTFIEQLISKYRLQLTVINPSFFLFVIIFLYSTTLHRNYMINAINAEFFFFNNVEILVLFHDLWRN